MFRGLYAAASALDAAQRAHEVTADNLANVSTPGFRQRGVRFETFDRLLGRDTPPAGDLLGTRGACSPRRKSVRQSVRRQAPALDPRAFAGKP